MMSDSAATAAAVPPVPQRSPRDRAFDALLWLGLGMTLIWSFLPSGMGEIGDAIAGSDRMGQFLSGFLSPSFRYWETYLRLMLETVQMAVWGTVLSVILAVPFGLLSSANLSPAWLVFPIRRLMDLLRSINELVFALIFVVAVGLGPLAGVLALGVHTAGVLAKLFSEAVESIDARPVEGIRTTGAARLEEILYGVIPQVLPLWISYTLYRFESNVRSAAVLGIVGAGGIGMSLSESLRGFDYSAGSAILLIILFSVSLLDILGAALRRVIIEGDGHGRFLLVALFTTVVIVGCEWLVRAGAS